MIDPKPTPLPEDAPIIVLAAEAIRQFGLGLKAGWQNVQKRDAEDMGTTERFENIETVIGLLYLRAAYRAAKRGDVAKTILWSSMGARQSLARNMRRSRVLNERQMDVLIHQTMPVTSKRPPQSPGAP